MDASSPYVLTDFGAVRLGPKTVAYLNGISPEWQEILLNRRRRGKRASYVREKVKEVEVAVCVAAAIEWASGGELEEF